MHSTAVSCRGKENQDDPNTPNLELKLLVLNNSTKDVGNDWSAIVVRGYGMQGQTQIQ